MNGAAAVLGRRWLVPEVVQTSATDCGPACLKGALEGFGIPISYARLREACQTDVDGTSIDTIEALANELGLEAEQVMVPVEHVLLPEAHLLPAIAVVTDADGSLHFVVAWRQHGGLVQILDPAAGRQWLSAEAFTRRLYVHEMSVPAVDWAAWAASDEFRRPLLRRLAALGRSPGFAARLLQRVDRLKAWWSPAHVDAAARLTSAFVRSGAVKRGDEARRVIERLCDDAGARLATVGHRARLVVGRARGRPGRSGRLRAAAGRGAGAVSPPATGIGRARAGRERRRRPDRRLRVDRARVVAARELLRHLRSDGVSSVAGLVAALVVSAAAVLLEAVLLRGLIESHVRTSPWSSGSRAWARSWRSSRPCRCSRSDDDGRRRPGRHLEVRLRIRFLRAFRGSGSGTFASRLASDLADRAHSAPAVRGAPGLGAQLIQVIVGLLVTALGLVWLDPASAPLVLVAALAAIACPLVARARLVERDMRVRTHTGALTRFYLDALLGLVALRAHRGEQALREEHRRLLAAWCRSALDCQRLVVAVDAAVMLVGYGLACWLVLGFLGRHPGSPNGLLLVDGCSRCRGSDRRPSPWPAGMPFRATSRRGCSSRCGSRRSRRRARPARDPTRRRTTTAPEPAPAPGVAVEFRDVTLLLAGHVVLDDVQLHIEPGVHVAVVGASARARRAWWACCSAGLPTRGRCSSTGSRSTRPS